MDEEIFALLIPILSAIGLFTAISLNIYYKYKTTSTLSERLPHESLSEWLQINARVHAARSRGNGFRWGGFLAGLGLGVAVGCIVIASGGLESLANESEFDAYVIATFMVISLAIFCSGAGMIGAYFLERKLDGKVK